MKKFYENVFLYRVFNFCVLSFLLLSFPYVSFSQVPTLKAVQAQITKNIGGFYESLPVDYNTQPTKKYPLIIFCHGSGERGNGTTNITKLTAAGLPKVINNGKFPASFNVGGENYSFIVIMPQIKDVLDLPGGIQKTIDYAVQNYRVDEERIYLTGLSLGGISSWFYVHSAQSYGERLAAMLLVCPGVDSVYYGSTTLGRQRIKNVIDSKLPIWVTTNSNDPLAYTWNQVALVDSLNKNKITPPAKLTIFPANGHDAWTKTYDPNFKENGMNVYEWLLTNKRPGVATPLPPTANAGTAQTITLPINSVTLDGTKSTASSGSIKTYLWTKISGPSSGTISSPAASSTKVTNLQEGTYEFQLTVTDDNGKTGTAKVTVKVNPAPLPPVANAGSSQTITLPSSSVTLNGSASTAPSGTITTYQWTKLSGPTQFTIEKPALVTTTVSGLVQGVYVFQLKVTDNNGNSSTASVTIIVNAAPKPPVAEAGDAQTINLPKDTAALDGSASTAPAGNIAKYEWSKLSGPSGGTIVSAANAKTIVTGLKEGVYEFQLKVTDNLGTSSVDIVVVTVNAAPVPPVANAGTDIIIQLPVDAVSLDGTGSSSVAGVIKGYDWKKASGPSQGVINDPTQAKTTATGLVEGVYVFELKVTDDKGLSSIASVKVTVKAAALPPVANAGADQTITLPVNSVNLDAGGSTSPSGSIVSYEWSKLSGPVDGTLSSSVVSNPTATGLVEGIYKFQVKVTDDKGLSATASVTITVKAALLPPVSNAGIAQTIVLPVNSVTLDGSKSTAPSGSIVSYAWKKLSGGAASISDAGSSKTLVNGLIEGVYQFELKVTDNNGLSSTSIVTVTVKAAPLPPVANAGSAQTIILPKDSVTIDGSKSTSSSGTIVIYEWTKLSGPADGTISSATSAVTSVVGLVEGIYVFELKVTDDNGLSSTATITITVSKNLVLPGADAGSDIIITLPINNTVLDAGGSTAASGIASYTWSKASGPAGGTIANPSGVTTAINDLLEGVYEFELEVKDNDGQISTDKVTVTVKAAPQPPVADAGADIEITLPLNSVTLDGSASTSPLDSIVAYAWSKVSGPANGLLANASNVSTAVTNLTEGVYEFELKVTGNNGLSSTALVTVKVNAAPVPPVANAGKDITIQLPVDAVSLDGTGSSSVAGVIKAYDWKKASGPSQGVINDPTQAKTTATGLVEGVYVFELKVTDDKGLSSIASVKVTVKAAALPPVANAGTDQTITLPVNSVNLDAGGSTSPSGSIVGYEWSKLSGPVDGILPSLVISNPTATGLVEGIYKFQVKVTDDKGLSATASVTITVKAALLPPVSNAGIAQTIVLPVNSVTLDGSKSTAPSGSIVSYAWKKLSGGAASISDAGSSKTLVNGLIEGVYQFELKVTDNNGLSSTSIVTVTVKAAPPPPVANTGDAQTIVLPINTVTLDGSKSSAAAGIAGYKWSLLSGPEGSIINTANKAITAVTKLVEGVYNFQLEVTDSSSATATASIIVTVKAAPLPPVANAGIAQTITLPINTVTLNATLSSAPAGTIKSFIWTKISGPSTGEITNPSNGMTTATNLVAGTYQFQVKVIDNNNNSSTATVSITVNPAVVKPPVADAGVDQKIQLPVNVIQLDGSKSYAQEGSIKSYNWKVISASSPISVLNATTSQPSVLSVPEGVYTFRLYVTDTYNSIDSADVTVMVLPKNAIPEPPVVYIQSDSIVSLPQTSIQLDGTSSYSIDRTIVKYEWSIVSGPAGAVIESAGSPVTNINSLAEGEYEFGLKVTDNEGGVAISVVKVLVNNPGGRPDLSQTVQVYPNPAENIINIKLSGEAKGRTMIDIYDANGRRVIHKEVIKDNSSFYQTVDVSQLKKGVYFIELIVDYRYRSSYKLVKL